MSAAPTGISLPASPRIAPSDPQHGVAVDEPPVAVVPAGGVFEGRIAIIGETRIAGTVRGSLSGPGRLVIEAGGRVEGPVECDEVRSEGAIIGPIVVRRRFELGPGGLFEGDLESPVVVVADSAIWNGKARVGA